LVGFTCGDYSRRLSKMARDDVIKTALDQLDQIFKTKSDSKPATNSFEDISTKDWTADRFIRGGYSSYSMQSKWDDREVMAKPLSDRVFFAGEHMHKNRFMVAHAAIETGQAASFAVLAALGKKQQSPPFIRSKL